MPEIIEMQKYWLNNYINSPNNKIIFKHNDNIVIQGLWVGNTLTKIHKLCIESFLKKGHAFVLYTYEKVNNLPDMVITMDANKIIPSSLIYTFDDSYAGFSDLFRNRLLSLNPGWYVDLDIYCIKKYDFDDKLIFSLDYLSPHSTVKCIMRDNKKCYVETNPCKSDANCPIFKLSFLYILNKILFDKIKKNVFENLESMTVNLFFEKMNKLNLLNIYTEYYSNDFKNKQLIITFNDLCITNNITSVGQQSWSELGPGLLTNLVVEHNLINYCKSPILLQGLITYSEVSNYLNKKFNYKILLQQNVCHSFNLFYTMWKRNDMLKLVDNIEITKGTLFEQMLNFSI
jgi:hypothetical protein